MNTELIPSRSSPFFELESRLWDHYCGHGSFGATG